MRKNSALIFFVLLGPGCASPSRNVYVDLQSIRLEPFPAAAQSVRPVLPKPLPSQSFVLSGVPAKTLASSSSAEVVASQADAREAQEAALETIKKRLIKIYKRQIDLFAAQQKSLAPDSDSLRVQEALPALYAAFQRYATARLPLISRLSYLAGLPDTNPKNAPPPATLRPVPRSRWVEANALRSRIYGLDDSYSNEATDILAKASGLAAVDRFNLLKKVEDFRRQMMDRALQEAAAPIRSRAPAILRLQAAPSIVLPQVAPESVEIPATPALPASPQVESVRSGESERISKELLRRQLVIWAAINQFSVVPKLSSNVRDATKDFERWRSQQKVGP
jgi:hypothetical protein